MFDKPSVKELREAAKAMGLKGYSRMRKSEMEALLEPVVVWKGDTKIERFLGRAYLRTCEVERWRRVGARDRFRWSPAAWLVPRFRLAGLSPLSIHELDTQPLSWQWLPARTNRVELDIVPEDSHSPVWQCPSTKL